MRKSLILLLASVATLAITSAALAAHGVFDGHNGHSIPTATYSYVASTEAGLSVRTGGSFNSYAAEVAMTPTPTIPAGTYLVTLNAKVSPTSGGSGAVQVFPGLFLYDQAKNPSFSGDLLNICNGPLEWGVNDGIDGYCSGTTVVTLDAPTTLHIYAFGYDSDTGLGHYNLHDAELYITKIDGPPKH